MVPDVTASKWPRAAEETATGLEDAIFNQQWENDLGQATGTLRWKLLAPAARHLLKALAGKPDIAEPMIAVDFSGLLPAVNDGDG